MAFPAQGYPQKFFFKTTPLHPNTPTSKMGLAAPATPHLPTPYPPNYQQIMGFTSPAYPNIYLPPYPPYPTINGVKTCPALPHIFPTPYHPTLTQHPMGLPARLPSPNFTPTPYPTQIYPQKSMALTCQPFTPHFTFPPTHPQYPPKIMGKPCPSYPPHFLTPLPNHTPQSMG
ncbi:hypothetical protein XENTR_v10007625 [Xenopus tropicalis]|nr:hypothetical protein XENTR_v10007625 [Xenopus tropicalis]